MNDDSGEVIRALVRKRIEETNKILAQLSQCYYNQEDCVEGTIEPMDCVEGTIEPIDDLQVSKALIITGVHAIQAAADFQQSLHRIQTLRLDEDESR